jgi:hypothetical protein
MSQLKTKFESIREGIPEKWLKKPDRIRKKPSAKLIQAMEWLEKFLLSKGRNAVPAQLCFYEAKKAGISLGTLRRARELMGVSCFFKNNKWYWWLHR